MARPISINTAGLRAYALAAKDCAPDCYKGLRSGIRAAGHLVGDDVRARTSWSTRIPRSVLVTVSSSSAKVSAGGDRAPDAAPLNHGGEGGFFRHPVFGRGDRARWTWVSQRARPFLEPALADNAGAAADLIADGVDRAFLDSIA